jgi:transketolase
VKEFYLTRKQVGTYEQTAWNLLFESYKENYPDLAMEYSRRMQSTLPLDWAKDLPLYSHNEPKAMATRNHSAEILNILCDRIPEIIGGSADLSESNLPKFKLMTDPFQKTNPLGRFFHFGVREHAMAAVCNGMFAHGGMRPFCATFLNFLGYALGAVRVSALSRFGIIYVMTHDSIGLGEDGPTHQPIEMLESLRSIPNLFVFRPADGNETCGAYQIALNRRSTPSVICLTRQATPTIAGTTPEKVCLGAYVLCDFSKPLEEVIEYKNENGSAESAIALVLVATGSELSLAVKTAEALIQLQEVRGSVRVVSMPSWELFEEQTAEYQISVFPNATPVMSIEASSPHGWQKYAHAPFGIHGYGASAHANDLYQHFGFTVPSLTSRALEVINYYKSSPFPVPSLLHRPKFANMRTADDLHAPQTASEA